MTMPWFVWAFDKVMAFHDYADRIVAPYKRAAKALSPAGGRARRPFSGGGRRASLSAPFASYPGAGPTSGHP